jgi:hypothetical protein
MRERIQLAISCTGVHFPKESILTGAGFYATTNCDKLSAVRDTMRLIPMRRAMQGQGHATTTTPLSMNARGGAAHAVFLDVDVFASAVAMW